MDNFSLRKKIIYKIDLKSIRVTLAVIMSLLIGNLFKFESHYLIALTSVIGIQGTIYGSVSNAKDRIIGTLIGIVLGLVTARFLSSNFIIISIGTFIIIYACNLLELKNSVVQANIIYLSIMIFPSPNDNAISLTISTLIGVAVAIIIDFILSPLELRNSLNKSYYDLRQNILSSCSKIFITNGDVELKDFHSKVISFKLLVEAYNNEYFKIKDKKLDFNLIDVLYKNLNGISFFIYSIIELRENNLSSENIISINKLLDLDIEALDYKESQDDKLLNFHVEKLLEYLERI